MKKLLAGSLALGLASAGAIGWAGTGSAQEVGFENLDATLSPTMVAAGATVTVTSVDPCPEGAGSLVWGYGNAGWFNLESPELTTDPVEEGEVTLTDGSWEVTFPAPSTSGAYDFVAVCDVPLPEVPEGEVADDVIEGGVDQAAAALSEGEHDEHAPSSTEPPEPTLPPDLNVTLPIYGPLGFTVQGAPAAATPVRGTPNFTG